MRIDIITVLPGLLKGPMDHSIVKRARDKGLAEVHIHDLRDFSTDKHHRVDDYAFGGEAGMVMMVEPIERAIRHLSSEREYDEVIYTSPDGLPFNQSEANRLALCSNLIILCGHYKGVDQRVRDHLVTREISIGDFVMTGGELAAAVITDSVIRLLPGAISDETSALTDSFQDGLLAPPVYTRPAEYRGWKVPDILLSGHAARIEEWKQEQSVKRTRKLRPGLMNEGE
jgi:tRNA (guanine37-N1)-methyltransferase